MIVALWGILQLQLLLPGMLVNGHWLPVFVPLLLVYFGVRAKPGLLLLFIFIGGLFHDLLVDHYFGAGPFVWGIVIFMVRSQRPYLEGGRWGGRVLVTFAGSFVYLVLDRLLFLVYHRFWSWDLDLSLHLVLLSGINSAISPFFVFLMDLLFERLEKKQRRTFHV